jgi:TrmH family RNA methyltransferase
VAARKLRLRKERVAVGAFLVDGVRAVSEALRSSRAVRELFVTAEVARRHPDLVQAARADGASVLTVTERVVKTLSETAHPQGVIAVVQIPGTDIESVLPDGRLFVLLGAVADPGNAGTVIRTAAAVGADGVVFGRGSVDPYGAKCVRASAGTVLHVPIVTDVDIADVVQRLRATGTQVLATALDGTDLFMLDGQLQRPTAWLFGGEAHGLNAALVDDADRTVRIPMTAGVESLNLAGAAAVCLYASARALGTRVT